MANLLPVTLAPKGEVCRLHDQWGQPYHLSTLQVPVPCTWGTYINIYIYTHHLMSAPAEVLTLNSVGQSGSTVQSQTTKPHMIFKVPLVHDDVIKWKHFPCHWPFVRGIHRWPVNSPHKGQWRSALMFSLIGSWINISVNNGEAGDLRQHCVHYDFTVMLSKFQIHSHWSGDINQEIWQNITTFCQLILKQASTFLIIFLEFVPGMLTFNTVIFNESGLVHILSESVSWMLMA